MPDQEFTQNIRVDGAEEAKRKLNEVGEATEGVSQATDKAGKSGKNAGGDFLSLNSIMGDTAKGAKAMIASYLGLGAIVTATGKFLSDLERIREIQRELSGDALAYSSATMALRNQLNITQEEGGEQRLFDILRKLQKDAGVDSVLTAAEIGISADIELGNSGGLRNESNLKVANLITQFVGEIDADGSQGADLVRLLKQTGELGSPEQAKLALTKIMEASEKSRALTIGDFVSQLLEGGMRMADGEGGVGGASLDDILEIGGLTVAQDTSAKEAAMTMDFLHRLVLGKGQERFTAEMTRVAASKGLSYRDMSKNERLALAREIFAGINSQAEENRIADMLEPAQGGRLIAAFRGSNVDATRGIGEAIENATPEMFDQSLVDYRNTALYRDRITKRETEYLKASAGMGTAFLNSIEELAEARFMVDKADRKTSWYKGDEFYIEKHMMDIFMGIRQGMAEAGIDISSLNDAFGQTTLGMMKAGKEPANIFTGFDDELLRKIAETIVRLQQEHPGSVPQIINHITVVQHQQVDGGNGYESSYVDLPGD